MKRILALLLTLMMALSLTACGGDNNADLVGTWKWTCDITEEFQKGINEGAGMDVPVEAKVEMTFVLVFNEDGTFTKTARFIAKYGHYGTPGVAA